MKTEILIKSRAPYYILKVTPETGKPFYVIGRDGKVISKSFTNKRNASKMLLSVNRVCATVPVLSDSQWLYCMNGMHGHCNQ